MQVKITNFIFIFGALAAVSLSKIVKPLTAFFPNVHTIYNYEIMK